MLGRKQSLKGDLILAHGDYGPEESLNENADIQWVKKVSEIYCWEILFKKSFNVMF